jgi:general secretion pathway protein C
MRILRSLLTAAVPASLALIAFLDANAVTALVGGTIVGGPLVTEAKASGRAQEDADAKAVADAASKARAKAGAEAILDRNPFDHVTGPLRRTGCKDTPEGCGEANVRNLDPATAPICEGVRPVVLVGDEDQKVAFASLDYGGKRILRRRGGEVGDARVAYVGRDRLWLEGGHGLCQALLFGAPPPPPPPKPAEGTSTTTTRSALETELGKQISKTGPNEFVIERSAVDRILEAQQELMKSRLVPEKEGDRTLGMKVFGIKPGSVLSMLGIENGDRLETINGFELSNPEKLLEAYARLRSGATDKLQVHLTRGGRPTNVDYTVR